MAKRKEKRSELIFRKNEVAFSKWNFFFLLIGIALIFIGFYLMAIGGVDSFSAVTLAPILLFVAYVIIIPVAILKKFKNGKS